MTTLDLPPAPAAKRTGAAPAVTGIHDGGRPARRLRAARGVGRGLAVGVPVALIATFITYGMTALTDTNPAAAVLGDLATPEDIERMNHEFGLDRPFLVQYVSWLGNAFTGDLGRSYFTTLPVSDSVTRALPVDLSLTLAAVALAVMGGALLGVGAAVNNGGRFDRAVTALCSAAGTVPPFVFGIAGISVFSVTLPWLPSGGYVPISEDPAQWLRFIVLPSVALAVEPAAEIARQLRDSLVGAMRQNYVTGAVVRGLSARRVVFGHALRNAAGPALTVLGIRIPMLIGGAVVTETVFNLPGLGQLTVQAAGQGDVPLIQGVLLTAVVLVLISNTVVNAALVKLRPQADRAGR